MDRIAIGDLFDRVARGAPEREAVVFPQAGVRWSYRDTLAQVQRLAKALIGLGVERRDHVAVWATNRPEWVLLQLASAKIGAALVPIDPRCRADELAYILEHCDATTLFLVDRVRERDALAGGAGRDTDALAGGGARDVDALALLAGCCPELPGARPARLASRRFPHLKRVALLDDHAAPGVLAWSAVLAAGAGISDHMLRRRQETVAADDPVHVHYTAGATGPPKGAELTHANLLLDAFYAGECMRLGASDRICVPVPFHHSLGYALGTIAAVCRAATMVVPAEHFDAETTLAVVAAERCTALHGLPTMFRAALAQRRFHDYDLASLRTGIIAGAPCPPGLMQQVVWRMHAREMTVGYGQAEASAVITQTRTEDPIDIRAGTVGRALPHVEVKIADPQTGRELPRGETGELRCRGYVVMRGYYKMPQATASVIDRDGWLRTGDLATMDEHGYCRISGRLADVVIRDGEHVLPREVEELLRSHPKVHDARVFGVPDPSIGQNVAVWIRLRDGATASVEEIRDFCRERTAYFKVPRYVRFVDDYPTTGAGDVQRFKMRDAMVEELKLRPAG